MSGTLLEQLRLYDEVEYYYERNDEKYREKLREMENIIKNINCEELIDVIQRKQFDQKELKYFYNLFNKLQTGDHILYNIKPRKIYCKYGKNCYRKHPGHKYHSHNINDDYWTQYILAYFKHS